MTRGDRHRLLDMQEAVRDLEAIVSRGHDEWEADKFLRLAAQKLLYELMWGQLVSQLPDLSDALSVVDASEDEPPR